MQHGQSKRHSLGVASLVALVLAGYGWSDPAWWAERGVALTNAAKQDYAPVAAGQLKWIATQGYVELEAHLPGGAGTGVAQRVSQFSPDGNYAPVNVGQLKYVAEPFYARLIAEEAVTNYPWTATATDDADFAPANIGQIKNVFSFDLMLDSDGDGMPDWWELKYGLNPHSNADADTDYDGDGLTNAEEYQHGTHANAVDTDGDGYSDKEEVTLGMDPLNGADGITKLEEARAKIVAHWGIIYATPLVFTNVHGSAADLQDLANALNGLSGKFYEQVTP